VNKRKIWIWSAFFGFLTSILLYLALFPSPEEPPQEPKVPDANIESPADEPVKPSQQLHPGPGKRAISVPVNEVQGLSGYLVPDSFVDVIAMVPPSEGGNVSSQILMQNLRVLITGTRIQNPLPVAPAQKGTSDQPVAVNDVPVDYRIVTLEVTPMEGAALALAAEQGSIYLMLRSTEDTSLVPHVHITLDELNKGVLTE
jgi:pilus assembly protein CpaB